MLQNKRLIVFPTSRAIREFIKSNDENRLLPKLLTIDTFFTKSLYFNNYSLIDMQEKFLYLNNVIEDINLSKLGIIKSFSQFLKQSDYIFRFFNELSGEKIDIDDIPKADIYEFYGEHITILRQIYYRYKNLLNEKKRIDKINLFEHHKINRDFLNEFDEIEINFEGYFTNLEFDILIEISQTKKLIINLKYYDFNEKSIQKFISLGFTLEKGYSYKLDISNIIVILKEKILVNRVDTEIKSFNARVLQVAFVKKSITNFIEKGISPNKIALILPDESFTRYLKLFDSEGYFNYAMGFDILESNLYLIQDAIIRYLNIPNELENIEFLELFLKKENIGIFLREKEKLISIESFESYITLIKSFEKNEEIIEKFDEIVFKFSSIIFKNNISVRFLEAIKIIQDITKDIKIDDKCGGAITVMGVLESRGIDYDAAIIVDFNEENIPKNSLKDKFLSTKIKKAVSLPTPTDRENLQKYYYKRISDNVKYLNISYVNSESSKVSRFLTLLDDSNNSISNTDSKYIDILYNKKALVRNEDAIVMQFDAKSFEWSATSLKNYLECKRRFYFKYILSLKHHEISKKPKSYEIGDIIHHILEKTFENFVNLEQSREKFEKLFSITKVDNPILSFELNLWRKKLDIFFDNEYKRFLNSNRVVAVEKAFKFKYEGIILKGKIDRIDFEEDIYTIIDYKTSTSLKIDTEKSYLDSVDFQLEFYFLALKSLYNLSNEYIKPYYYQLNGGKLLNEKMLFEKIERLNNIIREFTNELISFSKCEKISTCEFCDYKTICNR